MVPAEDELDFAGPAVLSAGDDSYDVRVWLSGRVEPVDGRYHWGGRIAAHDGVAQLVRDGRRAVTLRTADGRGSAVPARLGEVDAWGGVGVRATGTPPWAGAAGPDSSDVDSPRTRDAIVSTDVAIVGAGFGGLGAAIRLKQQGHDDFLVFEQAQDVGGTWRDNTYPGCACDVPSHLYSFSFARNPAWSDTFSGQAEIWAYLRATAVRFGVTPHLRLGQELLGADWDTPSGRWRVRTSHGEYSARVLVVATGPLSQPSTPDIPGLPTFAGTAFHSARWRHDVDLAGAPGGRHRHRGLGDPVRTGDRADGRVATPVPAHRALGAAAPLAPDHPPRARGVPVGAGRADADAGRAVLGPRAVRARLPAPPGQPDGLQHRPAAPAPAGARPGATGEAHAQLRHGLQAGAALQRLLPGADPGQRRGGDRRDPRGPPARGRDGRRRRAPGRCDHLRHRVPRHRPGRSPA